MNREEVLRKLKTCAPMLSIAVVAVCMAGSLNSYIAPTFAAEKSEAIADNDADSTEKKADKKGTDAEEEDKEETPAAKGSFELADGTYQGTGTGYAGDVTVSVEIKDKQITDIQVLSTSDDDAFFTRAKGVIDKIIKGQTLQVDVVTGATYSSNGIINAVKNALTGEADNSATGSSQAGNSAAAGSSTSAGTVADAAAYKDGTYYGSGTGFGGTLKVKVEISGGKIAAITITENSDGSSYIAKASALINTIIANQSTNVDTVSGATYSSVGIIQAVRDALSQAAVTDSGDSGSSGSSTNTSTANPGDSTVTGTMPYPDGIYYGTAEGYSGDITVGVVIQDKTIANIVVTKEQDDAAFFNRAMAVVTSVLKKQSISVDTVSGATYSSKGLLNAIKNALEEAKKAADGTSETTKTDATALQAAIANAETLVEASYTPASWSAMKVRLQDAREALQAKEQSTIDKALTNLKNAVNGLVKLGDTSEESTIYKDGEYSVSVVCSPDEDEDFDAYNLTMTVTIQKDRITGITNVSGDGDGGNTSYINRAANGTSSKTGVIAQIINAGNPDAVDAVTRATCTSKALVEGCRTALDQARRAKE